MTEEMRTENKGTAMQQSAVGIRKPDRGRALRMRCAGLRCADMWSAGVSCAGVMLALCLAIPARAQLGASPGSVFTPSGILADAVRDVRAANVGDTITILVSDSASAVANGVTNTSRKSAASASITGLAGFSSSGGRLSNL